MTNEKPDEVICLIDYKDKEKNERKKAMPVSNNQFRIDPPIVTNAEQSDLRLFGKNSISFGSGVGKSMANTQGTFLLTKINHLVTKLPENSCHFYINIIQSRQRRKIVSIYPAEELSLQTCESHACVLETFR